MGLDRNSLLSQGIKPEHINRVYKTMFVYSIGFNNLLKELAGKKYEPKKNCMEGLCNFALILCLRDILNYDWLDIKR